MREDGNLLLPSSHPRMAPQQCEHQVAVVQVAADGSRRHCTTTGDGLVSADGRVCAEGTLALEVRVPLPGVASMREVELQVEPMQMKLDVRAGEADAEDHHIPLPAEVDPEQVGAKWAKRSRVLTATLPLFSTQQPDAAARLHALMQQPPEAATLSHLQRAVDEVLETSGSHPDAMKDTTTATDLERKLRAAEAAAANAAGTAATTSAQLAAAMTATQTAAQQETALLAASAGLTDLKNFVQSAAAAASHPPAAAAAAAPPTRAENLAALMGASAGGARAEPTTAAVVAARLAANEAAARKAAEEAEGMRMEVEQLRAQAAAAAASAGVTTASELAARVAKLEAEAVADAEAARRQSESVRAEAAARKAEILAAAAASDLALASDTSVSAGTAERALDAALDRARLVQLNGHKKPGGGGLADLVSGRVLVEKSESLLAAAALAKVAFLNP